MLNHEENNNVPRHCNLEEISERAQKADPNESTDQILEDRRALLEFIHKQVAKLQEFRALDDSVKRISASDILAALEESFKNNEEDRG